jgi:DNA modification methylase
MIFPDDYVNKIHCADCLDFMKSIPDKSIDLVLTDPPYGLGFEYNCFTDTQDNLKSLVHNIMPEILRVSKRTVLTCGHTNMWHYPQADWVMAWINPAGANRNSWGFTCWQPILCYGKDPYLENGLGARQDIIQDNHISEKWINHPCPKPETFITKLIQRSSVKETDTILDPFCGSGTTCVAAKLLGRNYIGIEISPEYCKIAENRLRNTEEYLFKKVEK